MNEIYSCIEWTDIHFMYGWTNGNYRETQHLYYERQGNHFQQFHYKSLKYSVINKKCLCFKKEEFFYLCLHMIFHLRTVKYDTKVWLSVSETLCISTQMYYKFLDIFKKKRISLSLSLSLSLSFFVACRFLIKKINIK